MSSAGVSADTRPSEIDHTPPDAGPPRHEWTPLTTNTPGSSLSFSGYQAVVVATQPVPEAGNPSLSITVTPSAEPPSEIAAGENNHVPRRGFTYEEELFRTKWGWTAHDQVQQVLREETND